MGIQYNKCKAQAIIFFKKGVDKIKSGMFFQTQIAKKI